MRLLQGVLQRVRLMPSTKRRVTILHPMSGVLKPGRLTLLLGPPSSGKTTLLKALSGKLGAAKGGDLQVRGGQEAYGLGFLGLEQAGGRCGPSLGRLHPRRMRHACMQARAGLLP